MKEFQMIVTKDTGPLKASAVKNSKIIWKKIN